MSPSLYGCFNTNVVDAIIVDLKFILCTNYAFNRQVRSSWGGVTLPWFSPMLPFKYFGQALQTGLSPSEISIPYHSD